MAYDLALTGTPDIISFNPLTYTDRVIEAVEPREMCPRSHYVSVSDRIQVSSFFFLPETRE